MLIRLLRARNKINYPQEFKPTEVGTVDARAKLYGVGTQQLV